MPIIRKKLAPSDVYPDDIRYNDTTDSVQRLINGVWEDAPESDPRTQTTLPPRITSDTACDAAASVVAALKNQIDAILLAIDNGATAFTIAGLILGLFTFGVFAIFIAIALFIADIMLSAGSTAIDEALTESVYDQLTCILYCEMNSQGRIAPGSLTSIQAQVDAQIGGLGAIILNAMLGLAGEGGINNLASLGTSTGDCSECDDCGTWCYKFDFAIDDGEWIPLTAATGVWGVYDSGDGWRHGDAQQFTGSPYNGSRDCAISRTFTSAFITEVEIYLNYTRGSFTSGGAAAYVLQLNDVTKELVTFGNIVSGNGQTRLYTQPAALANKVYIEYRSSLDTTLPITYSGDVLIMSVTLRGTGTNPFGANNCS